MKILGSQRTVDTCVLAAVAMASLQAACSSGRSIPAWVQAGSATTSSPEVMFVGVANSGGIKNVELATSAATNRARQALVVEMEGWVAKAVADCQRPTPPQEASPKPPPALDGGQAEAVRVDAPWRSPEGIVYARAQLPLATLLKWLDDPDVLDSMARRYDCERGDFRRKVVAYVSANR